MACKARILHPLLEPALQESGMKHSFLIRHVFFAIGNVIDSTCLASLLLSTRSGRDTGGKGGRRNEIELEGSTPKHGDMTFTIRIDRALK